MGDVETGWPLPGASAGAEGTGRSGKEELEGEEELARPRVGRAREPAASSHSERSPRGGFVKRCTLEKSSGKTQRGRQPLAGPSPPFAVTLPEGAAPLQARES